MAEQPSESLPETPPVETPAEPERSFSQADVDRIVQDRLKRQAAQYQGFEDLKAKAAQFDEIQAANQSELEKATARAAELERQLTSAAQTAQEERLRAAIVSEAAKRSVRDPDAAVALLDRTLLEFEEDGSPKNVAEAMEALLQARDYLVAPTGGQRGNADQGARPATAAAGQLSQDDLKSMTSAEIVKAQNDGRLNDLLGVKP